MHGRVDPRPALGEEDVAAIESREGQVGQTWTILMAQSNRGPKLLKMSAKRID